MVNPSTEIFVHIFIKSNSISERKATDRIQVKSDQMNPFNQSTQELTKSNPELPVLDQLPKENPTADLPKQTGITQTKQKVILMLCNIFLLTKYLQVHG